MELIPIITPVVAAGGSRCDIHHERPAVAWIAARIGTTIGDPCLGCVECVEHTLA